MNFLNNMGGLGSLASGLTGSGNDKKCPPIPKINQVYADLCKAIKDASPTITQGFIDSFKTVFATGPTDPQGIDICC